MHISRSYFVVSVKRREDVSSRATGAERKAMCERFRALPIRARRFATRAKALSAFYAADIPADLREWLEVCEQSDLYFSR